jgi:hypothetical protein
VRAEGYEAQPLMPSVAELKVSPEDSVPRHHVVDEGVELTVEPVARGKTRRKRPPVREHVEPAKAHARAAQLSAPQTSRNAKASVSASRESQGRRVRREIVDADAVRPAVDVHMSARVLYAVGTLYGEGGHVNLEEEL